MNQIRIEYLRTKSRKLKKRILRKNFIKQINFNNYFKYNLLTYFIRKEDFFINKKILSYLLFTEKGISFSIKKLITDFYSKIY